MRRRGVLWPSTTEAQRLEPPVPCLTRKRLRSIYLWAGLVLLGALVSACGSSQEERAASASAQGAGAGPVAGPTIHETTGAGEPRAVVLRQQLREQARLWNVGYPMLTESVEVCRGRTRPNLGFVAWTRWDIDPYYRIASMGVFGLDDRLRVVHVLPGSPAAAAGLLAGDEIEVIGHHRMPAGKTASAALELALQREAVVGVAQTIRVRRGEARHAFAIVPRAQCDVDLIVTGSDQVNAFNYGRSIYVTHGLMRLLSDDRELAALAAHFVGHGLLEHEARSDEETMAGQLKTHIDDLRWALLGEEKKSEMMKAGIWPGSRPYTAKQEFHADRAALELRARAGYPMEALVDVWRRLAEVQHGRLLRQYHALSQERQAAVQDILTQVRSEAGAGGPEPGS